MMHIAFKIDLMSGEITIETEASMDRAVLRCRQYSLGLCLPAICHKGITRTTASLVHTRANRVTSARIEAGTPEQVGPGRFTSVPSLRLGWVGPRSGKRYRKT
jgi:hypothetical protein